MILLLSTVLQKISLWGVRPIHGANVSFPYARLTGQPTSGNPHKYCAFSYPQPHEPPYNGGI